MQDANNTPLSLALVIGCPELDLNLRFDVFNLVYAVIQKKCSGTFCGNFFLNFNLFLMIVVLFLRIPIVDLRRSESSPTRTPHWKRNLHKESVRLTLMDVRLEMPKFDVSRLRQYGTVIISTSAVNGIMFFL